MNLSSGVHMPNWLLDSAFKKNGTLVAISEEAAAPGRKDDE
jgi:hypothetical protein